MRLLFSKELSLYDKLEYYLTCARVRTYNEHTQPKMYGLEHTITDNHSAHKKLSLENLYYYRTFLELFKTLRSYEIPLSIK